MTGYEWPEGNIPIMTPGHITQLAEDMIQHSANGSYLIRGQGDATWRRCPKIVLPESFTRLHNLNGERHLLSARDHPSPRRTQPGLETLDGTR